MGLGFIYPQCAYAAGALVIRRHTTDNLHRKRATWAHAQQPHELNSKEKTNSKFQKGIAWLESGGAPTNGRTYISPILADCNTTTATAT